MDGNCREFLRNSRDLMHLKKSLVISTDPVSAAIYFCYSVTRCNFSAIPLFPGSFAFDP